MKLIDEGGGDYGYGGGGGGGGGTSGGGATSGGTSSPAPPMPTPTPVSSNPTPTLLTPDDPTKQGGASLADVLLQTMRGRERMKGGQYAVMQGGQSSGGGALVWVVLALIGAGVWYWYKSHGA